jgi:3-phosphoshikimate 1-carboxyvinyltransferase
MRQRPVGDLVTALRQLHVDASCVKQNGCPPVLVRAGGIPGGEVEIAGSESSQFVSSLLLAGPYASRGIGVRIAKDLVSKPYVDMTVDVMEQFGVRAERDGYRYFRVHPGQPYQPREVTVEGDASSASYFWAAAAVTGGTVVTDHIQPLSTKQGDIRFLDLLEEMGCRVERASDHVVVRGGALNGIEADMGSLPDMVPSLAAVALFARGETSIRNVRHLRYKESDRLRAVAGEWRRLGGRVDEMEDGLVLHGEEKLCGQEVNPHNDHRLAMSLAVVGLKVPGVRITNEDCVTKSFPQFWELWDRLS